MDNKTILLEPAKYNDGYAHEEKRCFYDVLRCYGTLKEEKHTPRTPVTLSSRTMRDKTTTRHPETPTQKPASDIVIKSEIVHKTTSLYVRPLVRRLAELSARAEVNVMGDRPEVLGLLSKVARAVTNVEDMILSGDFKGEQDRHLSDAMKHIKIAEDAFEKAEKSIKRRADEMRYLRRLLDESRSRFITTLSASKCNVSNDEELGLEFTEMGHIYRKAADETREELASASACTSDEQSRALSEIQRSVFSATKKVEWFVAMIRKREKLVRDTGQMLVEETGSTFPDFEPFPCVSLNEARNFEGGRERRVRKQRDTPDLVTISTSENQRQQRSDDSKRNDEVDNDEHDEEDQDRPGADKSKDNAAAVRARVVERWLLRPRLQRRVHVEQRTSEFVSPSPTKAATQTHVIEKWLSHTSSHLRHDETFATTNHQTSTMDEEKRIWIGDRFGNVHRRKDEVEVNECAKCKDSTTRKNESNDAVTEGYPNLSTLAARSPYFAHTSSTLENKNMSNMAHVRPTYAWAGEKSARTHKASFDLNFTKGSRSTRSNRVNNTHNYIRRPRRPRRPPPQSRPSRPIRRNSDEQCVRAYDIMRHAIAKMKRGIFDKTVRDLMKACDEADRTDHSLLCRPAFRSVLSCIETLSLDECDFIVDVADSKNDGLIDYRTFIAKMLNRSYRFSIISTRNRMRVEAARKRRFLERKNARAQARRAHYAALTESSARQGMRSRDQETRTRSVNGGENGTSYLSTPRHTNPSYRSLDHDMDTSGSEVSAYADDAEWAVFPSPSPSYRARSSVRDHSVESSFFAARGFNSNEKRPVYYRWS